MEGSVIHVRLPTRPVEEFRIESGSLASQSSGVSISIRYLLLLQCNSIDWSTYFKLSYSSNTENVLLLQVSHDSFSCISQTSITVQPLQQVQVGEAPYH